MIVRQFCPMEPSPIRSVPIYRFGPFELSERDGELRKNGVRIKLQEQPFRVLLELLASPGQIVTREELQQKLWPAHTFVDFDVGLNTAIRKLRQALGDDADAPRYIETVARRGYRFVAPVGVTEPLPAATAPSAEVALESLPGPKLLADPAPAGNRTRYLIAAISAAVLVILGVLGLRYFVTATPHLIVEKRITSNPEEAPVIGAVISPDGKYLAYSDPTGIYFRQIDTGEIHALAVPPGGGWVPTSWYPDSTHLLVSLHTLSFGPERLSPERYSSGVATRVWRVSILGGTPQPVIDDAIMGVASPDGNRIAFFRGGNGFEPRELWFADNDGSDLQQVLVPGAEHNFVSQVAWSPHGNRIAYIRMERPDRELWAIETMDVKTHATKTLKVSGRLADALCWGPDGRLFYGYQPENKGERFSSVVYELSVNEETGAAEGPETQLTDGTGIVSGMNITRDGKRIVIWRDSFLPQSFVTEYDGSGQKLEPLRRLTFDQNSNMVTTWTPDSRSIVFASNRSGIFHLYRQAIDATVPETIVENERIILSRRSPDDKNYVAIVDTDLAHKEPLGVLLVPIEGGPPKMLLRHPKISDIQCAHSPSTLCLLLTVGPQAKVYSLRLEDGSLQEFPLPFKEDARQWGLSPDGSTVGFLMNGPQDRLGRHAGQESPRVQGWRLAATACPRLGARQQELVHRQP